MISNFIVVYVMKQRLPVPQYQEQILAVNEYSNYIKTTI